ncbi:MAG: helix-turn-helix transcriptional regulator [Blautia producta]
MQLGQMIVKLRKEQGLTQETFAKKFNVTRQTVSNWENEVSQTKGY